MDKITNKQILEIATNNDMEYAMLKAFLEVESGGAGFSKDGKIIIQFEPNYFKKREPFAPSGAWSINGVDRQAAEWIAFNSAFSIDPDSAMESASIGMPQIMGAHWKLLGYASVGAMWDSFKQGEYQQVLALVRFIVADPILFKALRTRDYHTAASRYNGKDYKKMAVKWNREPYNISLAKAYAKYKV
jgi:hypothetical protein